MSSILFQAIKRLISRYFLQYTIKGEMKRPLLAKALTKSLEFIVEYKEQTEKAQPKPVPFSIAPDSLQNVKDVSPKHLIRLSSWHTKYGRPLATVVGAGQACRWVDFTKS